MQSHQLFLTINVTYAVEFKSLSWYFLEFFPLAESTAIFIQNPNVSSYFLVQIQKFLRWPGISHLLKFPHKHFHKTMRIRMIVYCGAMSFAPAQYHEIEFSISRIHQVACVPSPEKSNLIYSVNNSRVESTPIKSIIFLFAVSSNDNSSINPTQHWLHGLMRKLSGSRRWWVLGTPSVWLITWTRWENI